MITTPGFSPQPVLKPLSSSAIFLVLAIRPGKDAEGTVRQLLADLGDLQKTVGFRNAHADLSCVAGVGSDAWDRLFGDPRPVHLHPFRAIAGARYNAPATPGDLLFHIRAKQFDLCFELAAMLTRRLAGVADVVDEVHGFRYFDARDLLGFVDGTANPLGRDAERATIVACGSPFDGGSYVVVQKYLHDLSQWSLLSVEEQERIIGRTKLDNVERDDGGPSHVTLNTIVDEHGVEHDILRDNMPFGAVGSQEFGTYFIGYAADPSVTEEMLQHMFVGNPPGTYDRILDVSTPVTGCLFFVPSADFLDDPSIVKTAAAPAPVAPSERDRRDGDGSLRIGSLKGTPR